MCGTATASEPAKIGSHQGNNALFTLPLECYCGGPVSVQHLYSRQGKLSPVFDCASTAECCAGIYEDEFGIDAARLQVPTALVHCLKTRDVLPTPDRTGQWVNEWHRSATQWRQDMDRAEEDRWRTPSRGSVPS